MFDVKLARQVMFHSVFECVTELDLQELSLSQVCSRQTSSHYNLNPHTNHSYVGVFYKIFFYNFFKLHSI